MRYYRRVVDIFGLKVTTGEKVERVAPAAGGALEVRSRDERGGERVRRGRAVILATGYYDQPNRLNVPGEDLPHVSHFYDQAHPYHRKQVVVVGGANSAAEAALELYRGGAKVTLVHRHAEMSSTIKYWVLPDIQNRIKEAAMAARFNARVVGITPDFVRIEQDGKTEDLPADAVFLLTGYHTDRDFLRRCGVSIDSESCVPTHDPETLETNVPNVFLAGGRDRGDQHGAHLHRERAVSRRKGRRGNRGTTGAAG